MQVRKKGITAKVTIILNEEWATTLNKDEIREFITTRLTTSLGFRGKIKRIAFVDRPHAS